MDADGTNEGSFGKYCRASAPVGKPARRLKTTPVQIKFKRKTDTLDWVPLERTNLESRGLPLESSMQHFFAVIDAVSPAGI
jgi:hypothetical protein